MLRRHIADRNFPSDIPEDIYFSSCDNNFYHVHTLLGQGEEFFKEWLSRADEFPSMYEIRDSSNNIRHEIAAKSDEQALTLYLLKFNLPDDFIRGWKAVVR